MSKQLVNAKDADSDPVFRYTVARNQPRDDILATVSYASNQILAQRQINASKRQRHKSYDFPITVA